MKRSMGRMVTMLAAAAFAHAAWSQGLTPPGPENEDIAAQIGAKLPAYWTITTTNVSEPVPSGTPVTPKLGWRFAALIEPRETLYHAVEENVEGLTILTPSAGADGEGGETLYGTAEAQFHGGTWMLEVTIENEAYLTRGRPKSYFAGRTVVEGSAEVARAREQAAARAQAAREADHAGALENDRLEHERALAALADAHAREIEAARLELATVTERHKAALEAAREAAATELRTAQNAGEAALAVKRRELEDQLAMREAEFNSEAAARTAELEALTAAAGDAEALRAQAEATTRMMEALSAALATLENAQAEAFAGTGRVIEQRVGAVATLLAQARGAGDANAYRAVLETARESESAWLEEQAIRHGLASDDAEIRQQAWMGLTQSALANTPEGVALIAAHLDKEGDDPATLGFVLEALGPRLGESAKLRSIVANALPMAEQWANEIVGFSAQQGTYSTAAAALGAPDTDHCQGTSTIWSTKDPEPTVEWLRVRFETPVLMPTVTVAERRQTGLVTALSLWDRDGIETRYEVDDQEAGCKRDAKFELPEHAGFVRGVTVWVQTKENTSWGVDAVGITGLTIPDG